MSAGASSGTGFRAEESSGSGVLHSLEEVAEKTKAIRIDSPSKLGDYSMLRSELADISFVSKPIVAVSTLSQSAFALVDTATTAGLRERCQQLVQEDNLYAVATAFTPPWTTTQLRDSGAKSNAAALFGPKANVIVPTRVQLPWRCEPEVFVSTSPHHSAFFAELKSVNAAIFNQVMTYGAFGLIKSFFTKAEATSPSHRRFYRRPLVGYGLVAFAHCGYFVALEWVGKLFMTPVSAPDDNPPRLVSDQRILGPSILLRILGPSILLRPSHFTLSRQCDRWARLPFAGLQVFHPGLERAR